MRRLYSITLLLLLAGCDDKKTPEPVLSVEQEIQRATFIERIKSEMVYMPGGTFLMGDFCSVMRNGGSYCTSDKDNKPAHSVELSSFSISKFKITHEDYDFYLFINALPSIKYKETWNNKHLADMTLLKHSPAIISWTDADNFCGWLREQTGLSFSLPTEAQWEYAARNKGEYISIATDDDSLRYNQKTGVGENFATDEDRRIVANPLGIISPLIYFPVNKYPPSPAGLYGMADNGREWVNDWYDPEWYKKSAGKDPQGPAQGVVKDKETGQYWKVLRGAYHPTPGWPSGLTFSRGYLEPEPDYPAGNTARCVVNEPEPVNAANNG